MFSYTEWALTLLKAAGHKYIKRIPYQSGGKLRYRYIYNVTHTHAGKHVLDPDHMKVGTKLMLDKTSGKEVHGHITDVRGDLVSFEYDDGPRKGEVVTMGKDRLAAELDKVHGISGKLNAARAKQKTVVDKLKERGASEKQIAREQRRLDALGGEPEKAEPKKGGESEHAELLKRISELSAALDKDSSMHYVELPRSLRTVARGSIKSAFEQIKEDPSKYAPPEFSVEERVIPFYGLKDTSKKGHIEYGLQNKRAQVIAEAWVPSGYIAVVDDDMITLTVLDGEHAGKSVVTIPSSLLALHDMREKVQTLPPLSDGTLKRIDTVRRTLNAITPKTLPYRVAHGVDDFIETDLRNEIKTAEDFENELKRKLKDAVKYAVRNTRFSDAFEPTVDVTSKKDEGGRRFMFSISGQPYGSMLVSPREIGVFEVADNLSDDLARLHRSRVGGVAFNGMDDSYKASFVK